MDYSVFTNGLKRANQEYVEEVKRAFVKHGFVIKACEVLAWYARIDASYNTVEVQLSLRPWRHRGCDASFRDSSGHMGYRRRILSETGIRKLKSDIQGPPLTNP